MRRSSRPPPPHPLSRDALLRERPLVLIVDDDARTANALARLLGADGYDAEVSVDGAAALARLAEGPVPHAIVTDFHLRRGDGLSIGRYARSRRPAVPIFVVTSYPSSVARASAPLDQPLHVLTKPLDYGDLLRRLTAALPELARR